MKTEYEKLYEFITPLIMTGKLTPSEAAKILATVQLLEMRVNALEKAYHNVFAQEHAEHNNYDINDNVTINGDESIDELKKAV